MRSVCTVEDQMLTERNAHKRFSTSREVLSCYKRGLSPTAPSPALDSLHQGRDQLEGDGHVTGCVGR